MEALLTTMVEFLSKMCTSKLKGQPEEPIDEDLVVEQPDNEQSTGSQ
jgi:hypothetical protein